ncbi:hypothetical protein KC19_VG105200 [Ceratodon purpureus]|uniref:DUF4283 domain-containing protein n=1 Tax=Ceratodon purpureus TaxID=3225 RepID=A0A8T0HP71_CERPU|nr:hypothetical protein KC19_VG105200 [Ceratodon purpureus]
MESSIYGLEILHNSFHKIIMKGHGFFEVHFTEEAGRLETLLAPTFKYHRREVTFSTWNPHFQLERPSEEHRLNQPTLQPKLQYPIWVQIKNLPDEEQSEEVLREICSQIALVIAVDTNETYRLKLSKPRVRILVEDIKISP